MNTICKDCVHCVRAWRVWWQGGDNHTPSTRLCSAYKTDKGTDWTTGEHQGYTYAYCVTYNYKGNCERFEAKKAVKPKGTHQKFVFLLGIVLGFMVAYVPFWLVLILVIFTGTVYKLYKDTENGN